ncbi:Glu/Leu/Phe/Val family dehydrogenase [Ramlibacter solisilvae]
MFLGEATAPSSSNHDIRMNTKPTHSVPTSLFGLPGEDPHELILFGSDSDGGLRSIVAIHNTSRGPAFGGCRMWRYASDLAALTDALRLSQGMTFKNALADLPFGGGKAVIIAPEGASIDRSQLFHAFGDLVNSAGGRYITAEDVGTTTADMRMVASRSKFVSGLPRQGKFGGDPSPKTAWGVFLAIEQGLRLHLKKSLKGSTVAVQGLGSVGLALCEYLSDSGAQLIVADVDELRVAKAIGRFGARRVSPEEILEVSADVLAPCALGGVLNSTSVPKIRASIVAGAANNQLSRPEDGVMLRDRGVLYLPDFLINAGGIVSVAREYLGTGSESEVMSEVALIAGRVAELLERCQSGGSPAEVAETWARQKIGLGSSWSREVP